MEGSPADRARQAHDQKLDAAMARAARAARAGIDNHPPRTESPAPPGFFEKNLPATPEQLIRQIHRGYFPRLKVRHQQVVTLLTPITWLWCHWFPNLNPPRNLPCHAKNCPHCPTMRQQEKGYALVLTAKPEICLLTFANREEAVPIENITRVDSGSVIGLRVCLDKKQSSSQLQMEIASYQQVAYQLPEVTPARMDDFLCGYFGGISLALLARAKGWDIAKKETAPEQPDIIKLPSMKRA